MIRYNYDIINLKNIMSGYDTTYMYYVYMYYLVATYDNVSLTNDVTQRLLEGSFDMFSRIYKMFLLYYKDSVQNLHVYNVLCPTYICNNDLLVDFFYYNEWFIFSK